MWLHPSVRSRPSRRYHTTIMSDHIRATSLLVQLASNSEPIWSDASDVRLIRLESLNAHGTTRDEVGDSLFCVFDFDRFSEAQPMDISFSELK